MPIISSGGMDITLYTKTHLYEKFGHVFYNITETSVDFNITGLKLRLDNLFDGVKVLGKLNGVWRRQGDPDPTYLYFQRKAQINT